MTLRVTVEIVPFGEEELTRHIVTLYIRNIGRTQSRIDQCMYAVDIEDNEKNKQRLETTFTHIRSHGALTCVEKAIYEARREGFSI